LRGPFARSNPVAFPLQIESCVVVFFWIASPAARNDGNASYMSEFTRH
jgi:hypothetical protein